MIGTVTLRNWRAYADSSIDLGAPVVFFVAPNGVGKSSLVEAIRWCVVGQPAARKLKSAVRVGAVKAEVIVELYLESEQTAVRVSRTLTPTGKSTFEAVSGERSIEEPEYLALLSNAWAADHALIDRLMFSDPDLPAAKSAFPVRDHLASALGVTPLLNTAAELDVARKEISELVGDLRVRIEETESQTAAVDTTASNAQNELDDVNAKREQLQVAIETATSQVGVAEEWTRFRADVDNHNTEIQRLLAELGEVVEVDPDSPRESLKAAHDTTRAAVDETRDSIAAREVARARSASATELLGQSTSTCPTCLRPLAEHERLDALSRHDSELSTVDAADTEARSEMTAANARLRVLADFMARLAELPAPQGPTQEDPGPPAAETLALVRANDLELAEQTGRLRADIEASADRQALAKSLIEDRDALTLAANEEQLIITTVAVLNELADKTLRDRIDPLITELSHRWKLLFGTEGLTLEPSGELVVRTGGAELSMRDLSGGERATALLITRLLVAAATTQIPTIWFDEPLEHLDPRRRAGVARTLVRAGQTNTVAQVIVTTYEERIVRQLAAADPDNVRVVHAESAPNL